MRLSALLYQQSRKSRRGTEMQQNRDTSLTVREGDYSASTSSADISSSRGHAIGSSERAGPSYILDRYIISNPLYHGKESYGTIDGKIMLLDSIILNRISDKLSAYIRKGADAQTKEMATILQPFFKTIAEQSFHLTDEATRGKYNMHFALNAYNYLYKYYNDEGYKYNNLVKKWYWESGLDYAQN